MTKFEQAELKGRKKLKGFLDDYHYTDQQPTTNLYDRVDYYATSKKGNKSVFEIKDRNLINQWTGEVYDEILIEKSKVDAVMNRVIEKDFNKGFYACFNDDELYLFDLYNCPKRQSQMMLPKTTAGSNNEKVLKDVYFFKTDNAYKFQMINNKWKYIK